MIARNAGLIISSIAAVLFVVLVGVTFVGTLLRRRLPEEHLTKDSRDTIKLALGLVATMTAILLGLLVSSAKSSFDTTRSEVMQMAAKVALLDRVLLLYGPQTSDARRALHESVEEGIRRTWPTDERVQAQLSPNEETGDAVYVAISRLVPQDDAQHALKTQAASLMAQLAELQVLIQAQAVSSIAKPLLLALAVWLVVIFLGFGMLAPANPTSTLSVIAGAFSVACAVFIILELDHPFAGVVRVPSEPMLKVLANLSKEAS